MLQIIKEIMFKYSSKINGAVKVENAIIRYHHFFVVALQYLAVLNELYISIRHLCLHGIKILRGSDSSNHILTLNQKHTYIIQIR